VRLPFAVEQVDFENASCRGLDVDLFFFDEKGHASAENAKVVKKVCAACGALTICRDYILRHSEIHHGIWAMMTPREYMRLRAVMGYETEIEDPERGFEDPPVGALEELGDGETAS
jgi:hypothetical protein